MKLLIPTTEVKILSTLCQACVTYTPSPVMSGNQSDPSRGTVSISSQVQALSHSSLAWKQSSCEHLPCGKMIQMIQIKTSPLLPQADY